MKPDTKHICQAHEFCMYTGTSQHPPAMNCRHQQEHIYDEEECCKPCTWTRGTGIKATCVPIRREHG